MNLILLEADELDASGKAALRGARAAHVLDVLRAAPGDTVRAGLIDGPRGVAKVLTVEEDLVELACDLGAKAPERPSVDLLLAMPRPKVMKRLWAQLAALGVGRIAVVNAARVEPFYFDSHVIAPDFFRPLLIEGLQQAQDTRLPVVTLHRQFRPFVEDELDAAFPATQRLLAQPGSDMPVREAIGAASTDRVLLAVGPEGGWVPFEVDLLQQRGLKPVSMGPRTLRSDTACIALLSLVHAALRD